MGDQIFAQTFYRVETLHSRNLFRRAVKLLPVNLASEPEPQLSNFFLTASKGNLMGFTDPVADAGLKQATATADLAARKDGYAKLQTAFNQQVPFLLLNLPKEGIVASPKLGGVRLSSGGILMFDEMTIN